MKLALCGFFKIKRDLFEFLAAPDWVFLFLFIGAVDKIIFRSYYSQVGGIDLLPQYVSIAIVWFWLFGVNLGKYVLIGNKRTSIWCQILLYPCILSNL